jgi:uncharacterized integral membrane protein (TIGR00698 family)
MEANATTARKKLLDRSITTREIIFFLALAFCLSPLMSPPVALLLGIGIAQFIGHPYMHLNGRATQILLQVSVVGLGFGMQAEHALRAGRAGIWLTAVSIAGTGAVGLALGKLLGIDRKTSYLITTGTAICGGSAIAAVGPVIKAPEKQLSVALGTVFILNSLALFLFPAVGRALGLSQQQFGWWCALAIHDTSSVVGAAGRYGGEALEVATTVKLVRALWIMPVAFASAFIFRSKGSRIKAPWFIGLFVLAMLANTYIPAIASVQHYLTGIARACLTLTLFLIGCGLSFKVLQGTGARPLLQGLILWIVTAGVALWAVITLW